MNYSFILTEKCNWNCEYCVFPNLDKPKETNEQILRKHLPYIKRIINEDDDIEYIDIQGGEIGLLPEFILEIFLNNLQRKVIVCTNGLFMEKEMHLNEHIRPYIQLLQWHVCAEPNIQKIKDYHDELPISRGIVHNNINEIQRFVQNNNHIYFNYIDLEFDITEKRKADSKTYQNLYKAIEFLPNVDKDNLIRIKDRFKEDSELREFCYKFNKTVVINLANEDICLCQREIKSRIPLNENNLMNRVNKFPKDLFKPSMGCASCTRLYAGARTKTNQTKYINVDEKLGETLGMTIEEMYRDEPTFKKRNIEIVKILKIIKPKKIFEFACTYGFLASEIKNEVDVEYLCTNFLPSVVNYVKTQGIQTELFDAEDIPKRNLTNYDTFICTSLEHLENDLKIIGALPKGTHFIFSVPNFDDDMHFRKFDNEVQIYRRYKDLLIIKNIKRINYKNRNRIKFVVYGVIK
jgi:hypothetical protein